MKKKWRSFCTIKVKCTSSLKSPLTPKSVWREAQCLLCIGHWSEPWWTVENKLPFFESSNGTWDTEIRTPLSLLLSSIKILWVLLYMAHIHGTRNTEIRIRFHSMCPLWRHCACRCVAHPTRVANLKGGEKKWWRPHLSSSSQASYSENFAYEFLPWPPPTLKNL